MWPHSPVIHAKYTKVGEHLRRNTPSEMQCSMFCGGKRCKYEAGPASWKPNDMAIDGIYSHWITGQSQDRSLFWIIHISTNSSIKNLDIFPSDDLLAMARPNASTMSKHKIADQFKSLGIKSIINLQTPGEHASCGPNNLIHPQG